VSKKSAHLPSVLAIIENKIVFILLAVVIFFISVLNFTYLFVNKRVLGSSTEANKNISDIYEGQFNYWQDLVYSQPNYFPGLVELTKLAINNNDKVLARQYFDQAKSLNPNSRDLIEIENILEE